MLIKLDEEFELPVDEVYPYFRTPKDWPRLCVALVKWKIWAKRVSGMSRV